MSFGAAVRSVLGKYATFSGRARRSEFWWWDLAQGLIISLPYVLAVVLVVVTISTDPAATEPPPAALALVGLMFLLQLALLIPTVAVTVRRLHDTGRTGWWYLIGFVPFVGSVVLIVFLVMDSTPGTNPWGENPKGVGGDLYGYGAPQPYGTQQA